MMTRLQPTRARLLIVVGWWICAATAVAAESGQGIFEQKCAACHTVGGGKRVGPDLQGVTQQRERVWLARWIREPDKMLAEGDALAMQLLKESNNVPMPNLGLSEAEVSAVIAYLAASQSDAAPAAPTAPTVAAEADVAPTAMSSADIELGRNLFQGRVRFANSGPSCISCHHVKNDAVIGGGILAKELTTVFSRLGGEGVRAILGGPPFPVMQTAYHGKPLTGAETRALVGFLQQADEEHAYQQPRDYGWGLFVAGGSGAVALLASFALLGRRRKQRSVNQAIYDRQPPSA